MNPVETLATISTNQSFRKKFNRKIPHWVWLVGLAVVVSLLLWSSLLHSFVWDDWFIIWNQSNRNQISDSFGFNADYVRPVGLATWKILYTLFGLNPFFYHFLALLLHLGNSWLIYGIVVRLLGSRWWGFIAGLIFATFNLAWEPTFWLSAAFFDMQSTFFALLAFWLFINYDAKEEHNLKTLLRLICVAIAYILAIYSKESGVLLLPVLLCYDLLYRRSNRPSLLKASFYALLALIAVFFALTHTKDTSLTSKLVFSNLFSQLNALFRLPVAGFTNRLSQQLINQAKFSLILLPALLLLGGIIVVGLNQTMFNFNWHWLTWPEIKLFALGFLWMLIANTATLLLVYRAARFFYTPHIGTSLMFAAILATVVRVVSRLKISRKQRLVAWGAINYIFLLLTLTGIIAFEQGAQFYNEADNITHNVLTTAKQQVNQGATDLVFVDIPFEIKDNNVTGVFVWSDNATFAAAISLETHLDTSHVQLLHIAGNLENYAPFGTVISANDLPKPSPTRPIIRAYPKGSSYLLQVETSIK